MSLDRNSRQLAVVDIINQFKYLALQNARDLLTEYNTKNGFDQIVSTNSPVYYEGKNTRPLLEFSSPFLQRLSTQIVTVDDTKQLKYYPLVGYPTSALGVATHVGRAKDGDQLYLDVIPFQDEAVIRLSDTPVYPTQNYSYADGAVRSAVHGHQTGRSIQNFMNWKIQNQDYVIVSNDFMQCVKNIPGLRRSPAVVRYQSAVNGIMKEVMKELKNRGIPFTPTRAMTVAVKRLETASDKFIGWISPAIYGGDYGWCANFYGDGKGDTYLVDITFPRESITRHVHTSRYNF